MELLPKNCFLPRFHKKCFAFRGFFNFSEQSSSSVACVRGLGRPFFLVVVLAVVVVLPVGGVDGGGAVSDGGGGVGDGGLGGQVLSAGGLKTS